MCLSGVDLDHVVLNFARSGAGNAMQRIMERKLGAPGGENTPHRASASQLRSHL